MFDISLTGYADRDLRKDMQIAVEVDTALSIAARDGIGYALDYMREHGVIHTVALRVLASPHFHRKHLSD